MVFGREGTAGVPSGPFAGAGVPALGGLDSVLEEGLGVEGAASPGGVINGDCGDPATGSEDAGLEEIDSPGPVSPLACLASVVASLVSPPGMAGSMNWLEDGAAAVLRKPGRVPG
jgi:hypothetical protein